MRSKPRGGENDGSEAGLSDEESRRRDTQICIVDGFGPGSRGGGFKIVIRDLMRVR